MIYSNIKVTRQKREALDKRVPYEIDEKMFFVFKSGKDLNRAKNLLKKAGQDEKQ